MHYFYYKGRDFYCEKVRFAALAERFGTPLYVYSQRTFLEHLEKIKKAFAALNPLICYSVKANSNLALLKKMTGAGAGLDIVSGGELYRAKKVGCPPQRIVYASVGKTEQEIKDAIDYGILMFNVESLPELVKIDKIACALNKKVSVALRINPDVESGTHKYITTGKKETKFGLDIKTATSILLGRQAYAYVDIVGVHIHIGSQITQSTPFVKAIRRVKAFLKDMAARGVTLKYFNIGGGLGIVYDQEEPQTARVFAGKVVPLLAPLGVQVILEPGRFIVGNAGVFLTRVIYVKDGPGKKFIIVDGGMNDLLRPSLYEAYHKIVPIDKKGISRRKGEKRADVVGPICESGDFLGKDRELEVGPGAGLAVLGAGAYGFTMSSNYNSRPRAAEVLVDGSDAYCIRARETYDDLVAKERLV